MAKLFGTVIGASQVDDERANVQRLAVRAARSNELAARARLSRP